MDAVLKQKGFDVSHASDGVQALEIMENKHIDLVVIDLVMPIMDGYELAKVLRSTWENLPILMVTAKKEQRDKHEGFLAGTDDYMTKPVDEQEMVLRIKALLRRSKINSERRIEVGDIVLDYDSFTVKKGAVSVSLPQKEFRLLFMLLSFPGTIFTRIQLMDGIWGAEHTENDDTLNVHINRLRERFNDWPEFEIITIRGIGYRAVVSAQHLK